MAPLMAQARERGEKTSKADLLNETTVSMSDTAGWSVTARPGEVSVWMENELTLQPRDVANLIQALQFAQRRASGNDMDHPW